MIEIAGLTKRYGRVTVLDGVSLQVRPGEIVLMAGANGCGKSTTLRLLAGLSRPDAGRILVGGADVVASPSEARGALSYLPQSPRFDERLTPRQILAFYGRLRGVDASRVARVAHDWGLAGSLDITLARLSGGTRQRVALAVFDLPDAPVLVLDEPGLSLDPEWRHALQVRLRRAAAEGRAVLVATHLTGEWDGQADRCVLLAHGRVDREVHPAALREVFAPVPVSLALPSAS